MSHVESDLLAYLDGELNPAENQAVEAHLTHCASCTAALDELRMLAAGMGETLPLVYESIHLPAEAEARIRSALAAERTRLDRSGSLQQGITGLLAGLQSALRPLSKAAIPLMALLFVALSLNVARLPQQAGLQQTVVLGQNTLAPGSQAALRVVVRNSQSNQPISSANVAIQLRQAGLAKTVYSGTTDGTGSVPVQFDVPGDWQGPGELVINTESEFGEDELVSSIVLNRSYRLLVGSDKPVYQPGETLHLRTLALGTVDGKPAIGETVRFEVTDSSGRQLLSDVRTTSDFGIASIDLPLAADAALGQYQVQAKLGDTVSELNVTLGQAPLPQFKVDVTTDAPYYLAGDRLTGNVSASYFYGKPVAGAPVSLKLVGSKPTVKSPADSLDVFVQEQSGETDSAGNLVFQFDLPALPADAFDEDGAISLAIEATVIDAAGDSEFGWQRSTLADQPIIIDVVPEDGTLHTGVENILYVLTSYPDGQPAPTSLLVQIGSGSQIEQVTNDYGLAEVRFTPRSGADGERQVDVTATDATGHGGRVIISLPLDQTKETLLLRTDRALYLVGDTLAVEAIATGSGEAVYLDVIKGGQTLLTQSALVEDGKAVFGIDLPPELAGTFELNAYQVSGDADLLRDTRAIVVEAPEDLQVAISTDKLEYRPGEEAQVTVATTRAGEGVESAVGLSVVNEAVYAQREYQPGFARAYFILDKALQASAISLSASSTAATDARAEDAVREAQQLTAKASWAKYAGQDYSLAARSIDEDSRDQVNQERRRALSQLSLLISLALILASIAIAIIVVKGLRRSRVLGQAASHLLLTVIAFALAGAALLFVTQSLIDTLPQQLAPIALAVTGTVWLVLLLALLIYGIRRQDHRAQYVALWLFAYAVLLVLLTFAASQGATLASIWLTLLAVGFGMLLAALLLFGWGLRAEGEKAAGLIALLLALLVLPLVVALNTVDLEGTDVIEQITRPSVYGLNGGMLIGCAAPVTAPQVNEQLRAAQSTQSEAPTEGLQVESADSADETSIAVEQAREAPMPAMPVAESAAPGAESALSAAEPRAAEAPSAELMQAPAVTDGAPPVEASPTSQPMIPEVVALAPSTAVVTTTALLSPTITPTATRELTSSRDLTVAAVISETVDTGASDTSVQLTASATPETRTGEAELLPTATPMLTVTVTATITPALQGELAPRKVSAETPTATPTPTFLSDQPASAALTIDVTPAAQGTVESPTLEPTTPSPEPSSEPTALITQEPTPPPPANTLVPTPEPTLPSEAAAKGVAPSPAPQARTRRLAPPASLPIEALPIIRERFPQTLYWNPQLTTDANGRTQVSIPTGDTLTSWRITAQAVDRNGRLGGTTAPLVVFQPLFLVPGVPTELSVGQVASGQVRVFNYSPQPQTVRLMSQSTPGLQLSQSEQTVIVGPNDVASVQVQVLALQAGPQTATWIARSDTDQDARQIEITVR